MKQSQLDFIKSELRNNKEISRNFCLSNYISRLGARIDDLEKDGWVFETERRDGNYVYKMVKCGDKETLF